jgi:hypothetical protein
MDNESNITASLVSILILISLVAVAQAFPLALIELNREDGIIENTTAALFLVSGLIFLWCARAAHLSQRREGSYGVFFLTAWGILLIVFAGEEISWGQRIFDFATPEAIDQANKQNEFNVHNLYYFDSLGGTDKYVSILMLFMGLVLPIMDRFIPLMRQIGMPVPSLSCCILFAGAYLYGLYFKLMPTGVEADLQFTYFFSAIEVRELILSLATTCFAVHIYQQISRAPA